jgi:hypothetical protein
MNQIGQTEERTLNSLTKRNVKRVLRSVFPLFAVAFIAAGCARMAPQPSSEPIAVTVAVQTSALADRPRAQTGGQQAWRIDRQRSLIAITVHRGGALARLGHDHVVASRDIEGTAMQQEDEAGHPGSGHPGSGRAGPGQADLHFRLDQLTIDEPALRKEAGFDTQPGPDAIAGTRNNMLTRVLEAERFPLVAIHASWPTGTAGNDNMTRIKLDIALHGVTRTVETEARIASSGDTVSVEGSLRLNQSDFGIVPFSVMAGALAVKDGLDLRFEITLNKVAQ